MSKLVEALAAEGWVECAKEEYSRTNWEDSFSMPIGNKQCIYYKREFPKSDSDKGEWLIWSNEYRSWWGPNERGYTTNRDTAGRYSRKRAFDICADANHYSGATIKEIPVPVSFICYEQLKSSLEPRL